MKTRDGLIELSLSGRREDRDTFAMFRGTPEDIAAVCSTRIGEMRAEGFANATAYHGGQSVRYSRRSDAQWNASRGTPTRRRGTPASDEPSGGVVRTISHLQHDDLPPVIPILPDDPHTALVARLLASWQG